MNQENAGKPWSNDEINNLVTAFNNGESLEQLVATHKRTPYAIVGKLQTMGKVIMKQWAYYKVEHDPWVLVDVVRKMQEERS